MTYVDVGGGDPETSVVTASARGLSKYREGGRTRTVKW
jgi:hypothetical protein